MNSPRENGPGRFPWPCLYEFWSVVTNPEYWKEAASAPTRPGRRSRPGWLRRASGWLGGADQLGPCSDSYLIRPACGVPSFMMRASRPCASPTAPRPCSLETRLLALEELPTRRTLSPDLGFARPSAFASSFASIYLLGREFPATFQPTRGWALPTSQALGPHVVAGDGQWRHAVEPAGPPSLARGDPLGEDPRPDRGFFCLYTEGPGDLMILCSNTHTGPGDFASSIGRRLVELVKPRRSE